jgi:hypothetical protein
MSNIINPFKRDESTRTPASKKYKKYCYDFQCLDDGTKLGESKYCQLSDECQHMDYDENGIPIPMEAHILPVIGSRTGEVIEHRMICTGLADDRSLNERKEDDTVS